MTYMQKMVKILYFDIFDGEVIFAFQAQNNLQ